jgi:hypothetical protein
MDQSVGSEPQPAASAEPRHHRDERAWVGGAILIGLGVVLLVAQAVPDFGSFVVLVVGLALFGIFVVTRSYGALVPAGIVTGVGVGIVLTTQGGLHGGSAFLLSLAAGFISIWVIGAIFRVRENHAWPWIPGLILGLIGLSQLLREQGYDVGGLLRYGWPIILIALGVIVVVRGVNRRA